MSEAAKARRRRQIAAGQLTKDNGLRRESRIVRVEGPAPDRGQDDGVFRRPAGQRVWRPKR